MTKLESIVLTFLETMRDDIKRRSFDESGEQKNETLERFEELKKLIDEIKTGGEK